MLSYAEVRELLRGERLPAAFVDLDAFDTNVRRAVELVQRRGTPLRVATKSLRSVALLRRVLELGGDLTRGLMCYACEEAAFLAERGFDDLLVAYPAFQRSDLEHIARLTAHGKRVSVVADSREGVERIDEVGRARGIRLKVVLCVDMSLRLLGAKIHVGVRRSPLRDAKEVVALAHFVAHCAGAEFHGIMGYEAQVAGLGDDSPFERRMNRVKTLLKRRSVSELGTRRAAIVFALRRAGLEPRLVNGGGSGSLDTTTPETGVTEVTAGSAFYKPHLFDYYKNRHMKAFEPAAFFALEVTRKPGPNFVTCLGGGYVASGPPGLDKVPLPWLPRGLTLVAAEAAGEVQTPLRVPRGIEIALGDPIIFRHAKAGELGERFNELLLVQGSRIIDRVPTYRGERQCFF